MLTLRTSAAPLLAFIALALAGPALAEGQSHKIVKPHPTPCAPAEECRPCWIEPWLCKPPRPAPPCDVRPTGDCKTCWIEPWLCNPPISVPPRPTAPAPAEGEPHTPARSSELGSAKPAP